jgi:histidine triad (HIT) family protein
MNACLFCRLVKKEIPANVVYEDSDVLAFKDVDPKAPVHVLVIPKKHVARLRDVTPEDLPWVGSVHRTIGVLARTLDPEDRGFRVVVNNGGDAGQAVGHVHYHFLAGRKLQWPPG